MTELDKTYPTQSGTQYHIFAGVKKTAGGKNKLHVVPGSSFQLLLLYEVVARPVCLRFFITVCLSHVKVLQEYWSTKYVVRSTIVGYVLLLQGHQGQ